jgi:hypothetical protein
MGVGPEHSLDESIQALLATAEKSVQVNDLAALDWTTARADKTIAASRRLVKAVEKTHKARIPAALVKKRKVMALSTLGLLLVGVAVACIVTATDPAGLTVEYYADVDFKQAVCTRTETRVLKDYGESAPAKGVPKDGFAARWSGLLLVPESGTYSFYSQSDDGLRMYINDELVLDSWKDQGWLQSGTHGEADLTAGPRPIVIEYYDRNGAGALRVRWAGGPVPPNTVLAAPYLRKK